MAKCRIGEYVYPPGFPPPVDPAVWKSMARIEALNSIEKDGLMTFVRDEFSMGKDTVGIAKSLNVQEWYADNLLHEALQKVGRIDFKKGRYLSVWRRD